MDRLGSFEELVLIVVSRQAGDGYGVSVQSALEREIGETISLGAVYATLDRLEKKGLVRSDVGGSTPDRGGRRKRLFTITAPGTQAVQAMHRIRAGLGAGAAMPA
jgi:PadR family transcriptional regulator PadR